MCNVSRACCITKEEEEEAAAVEESQLGGQLVPRRPAPQRARCQKVSIVLSFLLNPNAAQKQFEEQKNHT